MGTTRTSSENTSNTGPVVGGKPINYGPARACHAVCTTNQSLTAFGTSTVVDGYTTGIGKRVLLGGQSTASENGPYVIQTDGSLLRDLYWSREFPITQGTTIVVLNGDTYEGTVWVATSSNTGLSPTITPDIDDVTITQVSYLLPAVPASSGNIPTLAADGSLQDSLRAFTTDTTLHGGSALNTRIPTELAVKTYIDTADALKLALAGGTMSGAIAMGSNKVTGLAVGTADGDAVALQQLQKEARTAILRPTGAIAENLDRLSIIEAATSGPVSGTIVCVALPLKAGDVVSNLTFVSQSTGVTGPQNWWFGLADSSYVVRAISADQTTTAWAANTAKTLAMATPYTVPTTGLYFAFMMVKCSGAVCTLNGVSKSSQNVVYGLSPVLCFRADTGQSTPPSTGTTLTLSANLGQVPYVYAS